MSGNSGSGSIDDRLRAARMNAANAGAGVSKPASPGRDSPSTAPAADGGAVDADALPPPYGYDAVDLILKSGERWGFPYGTLASVHLSGRELTIRFTFEIATIRGTGLEVLHGRLLTRACREIRETAGNARDFADAGTPIVDSIRVEPAG